MSMVGLMWWDECAGGSKNFVEEKLFENIKDKTWNRWSRFNRILKQISFWYEVEQVLF